MELRLFAPLKMTWLSKVKQSLFGFMGNMLTEIGKDVLVRAYPEFIHAVRDVQGPAEDHSAQLIATCAMRYFQVLPLRQRAADQDLFYNAVSVRYSILGHSVPLVIRSVVVLAELLKNGNDLIQCLLSSGSSITANPQICKDRIIKYASLMNEETIGIAILCMVLHPEGAHYRVTSFVDAVQSITKASLDWSTVVRNFDRKGISVDVAQFGEIFDALLSVSRGNSGLDIQSLWDGRWQHSETQLSFALAFVSSSPSTIDIDEISGLQRAYNPTDFINNEQDHTPFAEEARRDPTISVDAVSTLFELFQDCPDLPEDMRHALRELVHEKGWLLTCSICAIQKPWTLAQEDVVLQSFYQSLNKKESQYSYVLACLWFHDRQWVSSQLAQMHKDDLLKLPLILDNAEEQGWTEDLLTLLNALGIDLAALAHRNGIIEFDDWADDKKARNPEEFASLLAKFLLIKAQDEMRTARQEQPGPRTIPLAIKTVDAMLKVFEENGVGDSDELVTLERHCMQSYPRLINYGQGFDDIIEENGVHGNNLPRSCDEEMQELYKKMYAGELQFEAVLNILREYKTARDPREQDLFACMIHGLFDEYACFNEYPDGPLAVTACVFGGIIRFDILTGLSLRVGLGMILEAVRTYPRDASMYKFGLQAFEAFLDRLDEWPGYCQLLVDAPSLQGTSVYRKALDVINGAEGGGQADPETNGINGLPDGIGLPNGDFDEFLDPADIRQPFKSIYAEQVSPNVYAEPDEETQEKITFFFNNVSEQNIAAKVTELQRAIKPEHLSWFAALLVEERAKLEPNLQQLYLEILSILGLRDLWNEVVRETYVSVRKIMNAERTLQETAERKNLKSLASWLGSITIARDRPIKYKNISFLDLLIEGLETERLLLVIPFTCAVLSQASKSTVFKPPNPWIVEILKMLIEIYNDVPDLKLNHKFEIEVLCKELGIRRDTFAPSTYLRDRRERNDEMPNPLASGDLEGLDQFPISSIGRVGRNARFSPASLVAGIPDLEGRLTFPPQSGNPAFQARLHAVVHTAIRRAIVEIIAPVVERSVSIATEATAELVRKDFVREGDEERLLDCARQMVRQLAGSLALVTCKEPLRVSMTNYIRQGQQEFPEQAIPEGAVLMCVNDNLDTVCKVIEQSAEERSVPEVELALEEEVIRRRQHRAEHPSEPYHDSNFNGWSGCIPEPFKMSPAGLNQEQLALYHGFERKVQPSNGHASASSLDNGRQLPDVLQEPFPGPNLPTPAEPPAIPQRATHQEKSTIPSISDMTSATSHMTTNGTLPVNLLHDRVQALLLEMIRLSMGASAKSMRDLPEDDPILKFPAQIFETLLSLSPPEADRLASVIIGTQCSWLFENGRTALEVDVLVHILVRLFDISPIGQMRVLTYLTQAIGELLLNTPAIVALLRHQVLDVRLIDMALAKGLRNGEDEAVDLFAQYLDALLLIDNPAFLRADFSESLQALGDIIDEDPVDGPAPRLLQKLLDWGLPEQLGRGEESGTAVAHSQLQYTLSEWLDLCDRYGSDDRFNITFMSQIHQSKKLSTQEDMTQFLRICIEAAINGYGNDSVQGDEKYFVVDSVAKFLVAMIRHQALPNGTVKPKAAASIDATLTLIIVIMNYHTTVRGENFNQRVFFRLFSSILCELNDGLHDDVYLDRDVLLVFAKAFLSLEPRYFPSFIYSWLMLISHRMFMPLLLKTMDRQCWDAFRAIMEAALSYIGQLLGQSLVSPVTKDLYRGILRLLLIQHHDFPEFLAENHYHFCNIIPEHGSQLRNLVLSAYPSSFPELPDPFTAGLKVDRLEEVKHPPKISEDYIDALIYSQLKETVDQNLRRMDCPDSDITRIAAASYQKGARPIVDVAFLHSLVLYVGQVAISTAKGGPFFASDSSQAHFLTRLARVLQPEARHHFLSAIANQLRYPNSHTYYFSYALLHLFGGSETVGNQPQDMEIKQQITRVLLERLIVHRPHPWGLIITLLELLKNPAYRYWEQPFTRENPEVLLHSLIHPSTLTNISHRSKGSSPPSSPMSTKAHVRCCEAH